MVAMILLTLTVGSCGIRGEGDDSELTVTVVKGIEVVPADMGQAQVPVARYLTDSELIVFVSNPLYSGSCPPNAEAEAREDGTATLSIDDGNEGTCTADAIRYSFLVQAFSDTPTHLVVLEEGEEDVELDLSE